MAGVIDNKMYIFGGVTGEAGQGGGGTFLDDLWRLDPDQPERTETLTASSVVNRTHGDAVPEGKFLRRTMQVDIDSSECVSGVQVWIKLEHSCLHNVHISVNGPTIAPYREPATDWPVRTAVGASCSCIISLSLAAYWLTVWRTTAIGHGSWRRKPAVCRRLWKGHGQSEHSLQVRWGAGSRNHCLWLPDLAARVWRVSSCLGFVRSVGFCWLIHIPDPSSFRLLLLPSPPLSAAPSQLSAKPSIPVWMWQRWARCSWCLTMRLRMAWRTAAKVP